MKYPFFYEKNKLNFAITAFCYAAFAVLPIGTAFLFQMLLDVAVARDMEGWVRTVIFAIAITIFYVVVTVVKNHFKNRYLESALRRYKETIFMNLFGRSANLFQKQQVGEYLSAVSNDLNVIENAYLHGNVMLINMILILVGSVVAMIYLSPIFALVTLSLAVLPSLLIPSMGKRLAGTQQEVSLRNASFLSFIDDCLHGFAVIKAYLAERETRKRISVSNSDLETVKEKWRRKRDGLELFGFIHSMVVQFTIMIVGAVLAIQGRADIGIILAFVQLIVNFSVPISSIGPMWAGRKAAIALIEKSMALSKIKESESGEKRELSFEQKIEVRNISLSYGEKEIFHKFSQSFEKGKSYLIVGGSGSGKTTLLSILLNQNQEYDGSVTIDGVNMKGISESSLYDIVSVVPQNVYIFNCSIRDNITMFKSVDKGILDDAIENSGLSKLVAEKGLDYECGAGGSNLSGGEKQRIALARALCKKAPILIIDEGTSALDKTISEEIEYRILAMKHLTRILVAHKMNPDVQAEFDYVVDLDKLRQPTTW